MKVGIRSYTYSLSLSLSLSLFSLFSCILVCFFSCIYVCSVMLFFFGEGGVGLISHSYSSLNFLWRLFHQPEIVTLFQRIQMKVQYLSFNNLLSVDIIVSKLVSPFTCFKHHFDGAISYFVDQDLEDRVNFWSISYLFVFSALYCCFGFVVSCPTLFWFFDSLYPILI